MDYIKTVKSATVNGYGPRSIGGSDGLLSWLAPFVVGSKTLRSERLAGEPIRSQWGSWLESHARKLLADHRWIYVVWCYGTPIGAVREDGYTWIASRADLTGWSVTTSHHVGAVQAWMGHGECPCGHESYTACAVARAKEETPESPRGWMIIEEGRHI